MSEDRHAIIEERNATEQENVILGRMVDNLRAVETNLTNRCGELRAERDRLVAKLEQAEAEVVRWRGDYRVLAEKHETLIAANERATKLIKAIQRGYCPDPHCRLAMMQSGAGEHSPDCRVAPLLGER